MGLTGVFFSDALKRVGLRPNTDSQRNESENEELDISAESNSETRTGQTAPYMQLDEPIEMSSAPSTSPSPSEDRVQPMPVNIAELFPDDSPSTEETIAAIPDLRTSFMEHGLGGGSFGNYTIGTMFKSTYELANDIANGRDDTGSLTNDGKRSGTHSGIVKIADLFA